MEQDIPGDSLTPKIRNFFNHAGLLLRPALRYPLLYWKELLFFVIIPFSFYVGFYLLFKGIVPTRWQKKAAPVTGIVFAPAALVADWDLKSEEDIELSVFSVKCIQIKPSSVSPRISTGGVIEFYEKVNVSSKVSGRIEKIYVREGDVVARGKLLAKIEKLPLQLELRKQMAGYKQAESRLNLARERYSNARLGVERNLKDIERLVTQVKDLQVVLNKTRVTYDRKKTLFESEGLSKEEIENIRTGLMSTEARYLMAKKQLESARIGFRDQDLLRKLKSLPKNKKARRKALIDINSTVARSEMAVSKAALLAAAAELHATRIMLKETDIRAPINATVASRNMFVGEQVRGGAAMNPSEALMVLVNINDVYITMNVRESELSRLRIGQLLEFTVDGFPGKNFRARLEIINPLVNPETHTVTVKGRFRNVGKKLRPGMFVRTSIITGDAKSFLLVPAKAVLPREKNNGLVFLIRDSKTYKVDVVTGKQFGDKIEIVKGVKAGDILALEKQSQLRTGLLVKPVLTVSK